MSLDSSRHILGMRVDATSYEDASRRLINEEYRWQTRIIEIGSWESANLALSQRGNRVIRAAN